MPSRIVFPEKGRVELQTFSLRELGDNDIQVRTQYSLMSIGTETAILHQRYAADSHFARMFSYPQLKTGVQAIGVIEAAGNRVQDFKPGDRVFMRMAHGSHQVMNEVDCSPVPKEIDSKSACWCGLAKTAWRSAWAGRFDDLNSVLIIGAGPVGQMALRWASSSAVAEIVVTDVSEPRLQHALRGGATRTVSGPIAETVPEFASMNNGVGPPVVVDATGNAAVFRHALTASGRFGKVLILGDTGFPERQHLSADVMVKGLTIQATHDSHDRDGWTQRKVDTLFFDRVMDGGFDLKELITHEFSPRDCAEAYRLASDCAGQAMGILYDWSDI